MIILNKEEEAWILETHFDAAIPIHVEDFCGKVQVFAFPSVEKCVERYLAEYKDDLFSDAALDALRRGCRDFCRANGYHEDKYPKNWGYNLILEELPQKFEPRDAICKRLLSARSVENQTTFDLKATLDSGRVVFAVMAEGKVVSLAVTATSLAEAEKWVEISVETAPAYRGRGYAKAAIGALSAFLVEKGHTVLFKCHHGNLASRSAALACGFSDAGKFYYYVLRKDT